MADQYNIVSLLGEYRVRCLYSKTWVLREAATKKTQIMLVTEFMRSPGLSSALTALCGIVKATTDDKIQQVMIAGISLLDELLMKLKELVFFIFSLRSFLFSYFCDISIKISFLFVHTPLWFIFVLFIL